MPSSPEFDVVVETRHAQARMIAEEDWPTWFQRWATMVDLPPSPLGAYELSLTLTDDREIAELNGTYRQMDRPTDVLSFAALEDATPLAPELLETEPLYLGDIIISLDTAQRQADAAGHSLAWETVWLASHGFLHLLGWDHPDEEQLTAMLAKQDDLLQVIGWVSADRQG
ncbi:rRNA maturation RNase YbeY [Leptolyngbya sp. BL0902]|uniref:rRNA maturation RNase YbeY n=1 Tax=Leptolyngbya sp. BL0902 TaxID=1115757 RepID=UPI0018E883EC|nr:rRNA maturation RNase YbeY [Leptolyngbya sp. BL0902]